LKILLLLLALRVVEHPHRLVRALCPGKQLQVNFKPIGFQNWLNLLKVKPQTRGHLKAFVYRLFNKGKLYSDFHENPIGLVEVRGISKRSRRPADLTIDEFLLIWRLAPKSYQDMILVDRCTGLRAGELLAF